MPAERHHDRLVGTLGLDRHAVDGHRVEADVPETGRDRVQLDPVDRRRPTCSRSRGVASTRIRWCAQDSLRRAVVGGRQVEAGPTDRARDDVADADRGGRDDRRDGGSNRPLAAGRPGRGCRARPSPTTRASPATAADRIARILPRGPYTASHDHRPPVDAVRAAAPRTCGCSPTPVDREGYRTDETAYLQGGLPGAVALPTETAQVATLVRLAAAHRVPIVPRGAGTGLSGGAAGIDGALTIAFTAMDRIIEIDTGESRRRRAARDHQRGAQGGGREGGALLRPGPGLVRDVLDRRQPRDERRRPVLREVRPDPRLGAVARGRHGRRRPSSGPAARTSRTSPGTR